MLVAATESTTVDCWWFKHQAGKLAPWGSQMLVAATEGAKLACWRFKHQVGKLAS